MSNILRLIVVLAATFSMSASAEEASLQMEINYLLDKIKTTQCVFNRNGSRHQGAEAVAHIQRKYDYYRDDIDSAEDFIRLSASKSTVTRRAYTIECAGSEAMKSEQWLLQHLHKYRSAAPPAETF
jgi:hypothetical protein